MSLRCHICPDGLGEMADISCGDAWHSYSDNENIGISNVIIRTQRGKEILKKAISNKFLYLKEINISDVLDGQELTNKRREIFGRLFAMRLMLIPIPHYEGFSLYKAWSINNLSKKIFIILGTLKRIIKRSLWHRSRYN